MQIGDLDPADSDARERCARRLVEEFRDIAPDAWPTIGKARETVDECLQSGPLRVARVDDAIVGRIGGRHAYSRVWELHPLVVARMAQKRGIGSALVADLERIVAARGAMTLILGSDDEVGLTSLAGIELYPDPLAHLAQLQDRGGHAFTFYLKCGFVVTGVVPDAMASGSPISIWPNASVRDAVRSHLARPTARAVIIPGGCLHDDRIPT